MFGSCPDWINYFEKKFIYLFIYLFLKLLFACLGLGGGFVLGWCLFDLVLEFKFSSFILNKRSGLF